MRIRSEFVQAYREKWGVSADEASTLLNQVEREYVDEQIRKTELFDPVIESDQFSHQEDAYFAGFGAAIDILKGDMDGLE